MKITQEQFEEWLKGGQLNLSLIGMSNAGKTFWAKKLSDIGFRHWSCDDRIEHRLGDQLEKGGHRGIEDVAAWMGHPHDERFAKNQKEYLSQEAGAMGDSLNELKKGEMAQNGVIDTTGSLIYIDQSILEELKKETVVVWLQTNMEMGETLFKKFLAHPKPIVWGTHYQPLPGEPNQETLRRCYPKLLEYRIAEYARLADVIIPYQQPNRSATGKALLEIIKSKL